MLTYRTSHVYPQFAEDTVGVSATKYYGNLGPSLSNLSREPVDVAATVVSGSLRSLLRNVGTADATTLTPTLVSVEMRTALNSTSLSEDRVQTGVSVVSGMLKQTLFPYSNARDIAAVSASIVSGNLT